MQWDEKRKNDVTQEIFQILNVEQVKWEVNITLFHNQTYQLIII